MSNLNKVILIGRTTRDPEIRSTPKGTSVGEMSLAINRTWNDNGEKKEETTYVDVTMWGKTADLAGQYLRKGRAVCVEGRLQMDEWQDKTTGEKRRKLKVVADNIQFLGGKSEDGEQPRTRQSSRQDHTADAYDNDSSEIPF